MSAELPVHGCSERSARLLKPVLSYIGAFIKASQEGLWDAAERPEGWIPLVVAENKLGNQLVLDRLTAVTDYPTAVMNYSGMKGIPELQATMGRLLERTFLQGHAVEPTNVCISSGCSAILDNLFYCICDAGDGVLIPAPYYPAFDNDLQAKCQVHPLPFFLTEASSSSKPDSSSSSIRQQLDAAVAAAAAKGIPVKGLLVTNPNNPLGTIYAEETITEMVKWCLDNKVHYISDEIYALSVYKEEARFTSAITLAQQLLSTQAAAAAAAADDHIVVDGSSSGGSTSYSQAAVDTYVHLVYGLSKDWCGSGLRVGMLYSRNQRLHQALGSISAFASVSNHTQWALSQVLDDQDWTTAFLLQNQQLLEKSYDTLAEVLEQEGFPFTPAVAGMFVWVDLRRWLPEPTWDAELALWKGICDECKVILTPGKDCHAAEPGFFRLCFAWVPPEALPEAILRMKQALGAGQGGRCTIQ